MTAPLDTDTQILLRPPDQVMAPSSFGSVRPTRYSFSRTLLRRAARDRWTVSETKADLNDKGEGEVVFEVSIGAETFSFFALTKTIDESSHTDRVIAERWEISAVLCEGNLDGPLLDKLRHEVPLQENARLDPRVLVLTRGNRSVRFFQYLVDTLAKGNQPDPDRVGDAGYIMRSTAFYGNGKFGMRSFEGYPPGHPLSAPYRAQFLCAWLFRELSYLVVEHCATEKGGSKATSFDRQWRQYFGLGNATGLGLVPYAYKHPKIIDAWVRVREQALAEVRSLPRNENLSERLIAQIERMRQHFEAGTHDDCSPFLNSRQLARHIQKIGEAFKAVNDDPLPYDALYRWGESCDDEMTELIVSALIELHDGDDDAIDKMLTVDETATVDLSRTVGDVRTLIHERFDWLDSLALDEADANHFWWLLTDNSEEPRRAARAALDAAGRDMPIDIALRLFRLREQLCTWPPLTTLAEFIAACPEHRVAVERVVGAVEYGDTRDNACSQHYLPLMIQRLQLAMYGMENYKPKSTDWLRVTLFQGAPRIKDLNDLGRSTSESTRHNFDSWMWPPLPKGSSSTS